MGASEGNPRSMREGAVVGAKTGAGLRHPLCSMCPYEKWRFQRAGGGYFVEN